MQANDGNDTADLTEIVLPLLGETVEEATIVQWLKAPGDHVERGENLLEAETDKITVEVPALASGVLVEIVTAAGDTVPVGGVIARVRLDGSGATGPETTVRSERPSPNSLSDASTPLAAAYAGDDRADAPLGPLRRPDVGTVRASPAARRAARDLRVDIATLAASASGPRGRVTKADVLRRGEVAPAPAAEYRLTRVERASARVTQRSFQESPHFYVSVNCDVTELRRVLAARPVGVRVSLNDALVKATADALTAHPRLNATLVDDRLTLHPEVNMGVIIATAQGVVTAVVRGAEAMTVEQIGAKVRQIRTRIGAGAVQPGDVAGATFSISNLGMYGVDSFSAIILPPNVAILAAGAAKEEVVVRGSAMRLAETISLTVSADHRAVDGVAVAQFLDDLRGRLADPHAWMSS